MMKKIILAGLAVIWIIGFLLSWNFFYVGPNYWLGFVFGLIGFAVAGGSICLLEKGNRSTAETSCIPIYYTASFVVIMIALNLLFARMPMFVLMPVFVVANLIVILVYGILIYGAAKHFLRVRELTEYAPEKMKNTAEISQELTVLLSMAKDAQIRQELLKLKETVDYSSNISQSFSEDDETAFLEQLYSIQQELADNADTETLLGKIKDAAMTWQIRNSRINTTH